ncbi:type 1 glutamine amidotransferase [bacterium]|jgi:GMP synthase (glutamine-hydrolysing)|nr:type 1 glutamine amidotransferase [Candidatus Pelagibacter sp.]MDA9652397.1 type 1 glutamine amidotransferase [bacterium]|tara:strand:- start:19 stop:810 length:792 start_codon:yes stop_codon:yes gene_type:complete
MKNLNILICEGNTPDEGKIFQNVGIPTHTESLKESLAYYNKDLEIDVLNPCLELDLNEIVPKLKKYDGLIWGGSSLNIYNDTPEIRRQIAFMKECFKNIKKMLAICWGMQVAVTAAGGEVKKGTNGSHIGIANNIELTNNGLNNPLYKDKNNIFNTPAFNFDEVVTTPNNAVCLASNKINKIQGLNFKTGISEIWGLQYHPEITYQKMIDIIKFRKNALIKNRNRFKNEEDVNNHINFIEEEIKISEKNSRMLELRNWLNLIN